MSENSSGFNSFFGFLMAAIGSAVGFGNIWGFPYKMGTNGGFAFLICYLVLCVFVGFIVMFGELVLGRRDGCGPVGTYRAIGKRNNKHLGFMGWLAMLSAILLMGFYCTLGGYTLKYCVANIGAAFGAGWGYSGDTAEYFMNFVGNQGQAIVWMAIFLLLTALICIGGVSGGIEKFCSIGMPVLFLLLLIIIIRSATLPGAGAGFAFIFKPDWSMLAGRQAITTLSAAGGQMFFSLSLGMGAMITYGSYLSKDANLQSSSILIVVFDTIAALMAAMAVFPAVFAFGLEPAGGPGLLFMTMENVFADMGAVGFVFGFLFYLLVTIAGISSSISLLEVATVSFQEMSAKGGKEPMARRKALWIAVAIMAVENLVVAADGLGSTGMVQPLGFCWLDFLDLFAEGLMMPIGALVMTLIIGFIVGREGVLAEAELEGNKFGAIGFFMGCSKSIAPLGMLFILLGQIDSFFNLGWFS
ncbi:MAG: sodium-dependent transporter [Anaerovoracaceae bacterium]|jgi:NSS family neurotransmitter:Na+ symporter